METWETSPLILTEDDLAKSREMLRWPETRMSTPSIRNSPAQSRRFIAVTRASKRSTREARSTSNLFSTTISPRSATRYSSPPASSPGSTISGFTSRHHALVSPRPCRWSPAARFAVFATALAVIPIRLPIKGSDATYPRSALRNALEYTRRVEDMSSSSSASYPG